MSKLNIALENLIFIIKRFLFNKKNMIEYLNYSYNLY